MYLSSGWEYGGGRRHTIGFLTANISRRGGQDDFRIKHWLPWFQLHSKHASFMKNLDMTLSGCFAPPAHSCSQLRMQGTQSPPRSHFVAPDPIITVKMVRLVAVCLRG